MPEDRIRFRLLALLNNIGNYMKKIVIIHTVKATLNKLSEEIRINTSKGIEIYNIYDDYFAQLHEEIAFEHLQKIRLEKLELIIRAAELIRPDAIIVACSTLSLEANLLKKMFSTPVITIDEAMIDHVTELESSVVLFATSPNPVHSVVSRINASAAEKEKQINIKTVVCNEALPYLLNNDTEGLKEKVLECVKNEVPRNTAIVLAQNSSEFLKDDIGQITGSKVYCASPYLYTLIDEIAPYDC